MIGEIQFTDAEMANAKSDNGGNGHGKYVERRALDPDSSRAHELREEMQTLYGKVIDGYSPEWKAAAGSGGSRS